MEEQETRQTASAEEEVDRYSGRDAETRAGQAQAELRIRLTREELYACMTGRQERKAGKLRLIVETVLLGLVAAYCLTAFFLSGMTSLPSLLIGLAALLIAAAIWVVPVMVDRYDAGQEFAKKKVLRVRVYPEGLGFGSEDTFQFVPYAECCARFCKEMILLDFEGGVMVALPKRQTGEALWALLIERLCPAAEKKGTRAE